MEKQSIKDLDERYGGIKGGSLFVLGGRAGVGKYMMNDKSSHPDNVQNKHLLDLLKPIQDSTCLHMQCTECHGTGTKETGETCIHYISCPCPRCTPRY